MEKLLPFQEVRTEQVFLTIIHKSDIKKDNDIWSHKNAIDGRIPFSHSSNSAHMYASSSHIRMCDNEKTK